MKRHFILLLFIFLAMSGFARKAKYVFYFIGDGMGLNQVHLTEMYLGAMEGKKGITPITFASFPVAGMATTFSSSHPITDSAAAGTALSTGHKTYNSAVCMDEDKNCFESIAVKAKRAGKKVGVTTSVSVDHATPASFYAHQPYRKRYYEIAMQLPEAGFDFYAGAGFLRPHTTFDKKKAPEVYPIIEKAGYTIARGIEEYDKYKDNADKMVLIQKKGVPYNALPYAIDRKEGDMTLKQITESAIEFLTRDNKEGFFLMVEGGKIDWASHDNDPATVVHEVIDMDEAVKVAYAFYQQHPNETLIVITADHETGGLGIANGDFPLKLTQLQYQTVSADKLSEAMAQLRKDKQEKMSWQDMKLLLTQKMGFWKDIQLTKEQEARLHKVYDESFGNEKDMVESLYTRTEALASCAKEIMTEQAGLTWSTGGHSAAYAPVYAVGAGSELFNGKMDNTEIPKRIAKAAAYK